MNGRPTKRTRTRSLALLAALALGAAAPAAWSMGSAAARQVYGLMWTAPVVDLGPCIMTVMSPASIEERCIPWTRREAAGPAFHPPSGIVVAGGSDRQLHGLSARDGSRIYDVDIPGSLVSRPVISGGDAFFGTDEGHVLRVEVSTGRVVWDVEVDAEVTEPVSLSADAIYVPTGLDSVYAFSREDGSPRWVHKRALPRGITLRGQARPLVNTVETSSGSEERVFVGHASGAVVALEAATGRVLAEVDYARGEAFNDVDADPVMQSGQLLVAGHASGIHAIDPVTLKESWSIRELGIVRLSKAGPYMAVAAGPGKVLGIDARSGKVRWRFTYEKGAPTRLDVKGGRVHFASDRGPVYVLDLFSGRPLQYYGSGLGVAADLELVGDMMFVVSTAGKLHALSNAFRGTGQNRGAADLLPWRQ